ncbi:ATP-binding protein [Hydrogenophaga sp. RWCD_12]|uniref:ATP-binding protein n=1 Tax=Hydrogenophaga sp. RWCD_12 TaxID=3391190 RepID=UPI003984BF98
MIRPTALALAVALALLAGQPAQAQQQELQALDTLQTLALQDSGRALRALRAQAAAFEASPSVEVQRTYLSLLVGLASDTGQTAQADEAARRLMALAQERRDDVALVLATGSVVHRMAASGDTGGALEKLRQMEPVALRSGSAEALWVYHLMLGSLQNNTGQFEPALANILKSMDHARARPKQAQASLLRSRVQLALVYMAMKNGAQALQAIASADAFAQTLGATQARGTLQLNRGNVESGMGHQDRALEAYRSALQIAGGSGLVALQAAALNNMGDIHLLRKEYAQAEPLMRQARAKYQEAGDLGGAALAQANRGFSLMGQGQVDAGVTEVRAALAFLQGAGAKTMQETLLDELSRMYAQAGRYREAVETTREQQVLSKELFRVEREQAVATLQSQFDAVQRQRQIEQLAQENRVQDAELRTRRMQQIALAAGAALLLLGGGVVFALYRRTRRANRELQDAKRVAEEALQEKNLFLATASHDLRQPVHAMSLMVEAIGLRNQNQALTPLLADLKSSMNAMSQLFNALLDLSKLEAGQTPSRAVPVALQPVMGEVVRLFREQATLAGLTLRLRLPRRGAAVVADPVLLRQALVNLTHNAIRYTPPQGEILLGVRRRGADWLIEVWDTGIGIAADEEPQVFSPYFRSEHAWRMDSAGHGLGLAVVARCARLMGATHGFQSRQGQGSRFWLRLPALELPDASPSPHGSMGTSVADAAAHPVGRCLVVDDDPAVLTAWSALLESWGVQVCCVASGAKAQEALDQGFLPDAILCDQRLRSGESGFALLRALLERCPGASGAMVSGEFDSPELHDAEAEGYLVLRKPVDAGDLHAVLSAWLPMAQRPSGVEQPPSGGQT